MKTGILGATLLITATTIDDAVWLVPYTTSSHLPLSTKIIHGITFIATLECLSIVCIVISYLLKHGLLYALRSPSDAINGSEVDQEKKEDEEISFIMECVGASICWIIAIFLFVKKLIKRHRRKMKQQQKDEEAAAAAAVAAKQMVQEQQVPVYQQTLITTNSSMPTLQNAVHSYTYMSVNTNTFSEGSKSNNSGNNGNENNRIYGSPNESYGSLRNMISNLGESEEDFGKEKDINHDDNKTISHKNDEENDDVNKIPSTPSISMVIFFTTMGALDEISYFPALIMGKIFTPIELCVGAFIAAVLILSVISLFLAQCQPFVDCLDRIP